MKILSTIIGCFLLTTAIAQVGINTTNPDASSALDIQSTSTGVLIPRMNETQKDAISTPALGLLIFQIDGTNPGFYFYNGSGWDYLSANGVKEIDDLDDGINDSSSLFLGNDSGTNNTGIRNTAVGNNALENNTTANYNTAIGFQSLRDNTTGVSNTALGYDSMFQNTNGSRNVAIGVFTLANNSSGIDNIAVGYGSLISNTTGNYNLALGSEALRSNTTGNQNVAIGRQAIYENTTGYNNTAIGVESLVNNSSGFRNTAIGFRALNSNWIGEENSALGNEALQNNRRGDFNVAVGSSALNNNSNGSRNTAVGYGALYSFTGSGNSAFGYGTLYNTTGFKNSAFGYLTLYNNITGRGNSGFGYNVLFDNSTGTYNTAMGDSSLSNNTTGQQNAAFGFDTLTLNTTGNFNTALGVGSLTALSAGDNNTALGYGAGRLSNSTSSNNTFLGYEAGRGSSPHTINGSVMIGYQSGYSETNDNRLYIENSNSNSNNALIYGEFDNDILRTNGELQIGNPLTFGYAFPTNQGTANQVLTTAGDGTTSWNNITFTEVDGDVTNEIQDLNLVGNELQISGGGTSASMRALLNPKFPDGFEGAAPVSHLFSTGSYTVPAGKNLTITNIFSNRDNTSIQADGITLKYGEENFTWVQGLANPIIAEAGVVISCTGSCSQNTFNGLLTDASVTPLIRRSFTYTVPSGKMLVLLGASHSSGGAFSIYYDGGQQLYNGRGNSPLASSTASTNTFLNPMFFDEGQTVTFSGGGAVGWNGYLIDK